MQYDKSQILVMLSEEFERWREWLDALPVEQIEAQTLPGGWSIKDVVAHLMAWQRRTNARMEAGLENREPHLPPWMPGLDPREEEPVDVINTWIYETNRDRSWKNVYQDWQDGFQRLIELAEAVPEALLLATDRFPWLGDYPLGGILVSSVDHHNEHWEILHNGEE